MAVIYSITGKLETAKAVNVLLLIAVFGTAFQAMQATYRFRWKKAVLFACLFTMNPVFISQVFTSYNDLAVGALTVIALLLCMKIYTETADRLDYGMLFCTMAVACAVKFTAPVLIGIILLVFGLACLLKWRDKRILKPVAVVLAACIAGVCVLGINPYLTHIVEGKHLLYPVMGEGKYDIMNTNAPAGIAEKNRFAQLGYSLFSQTENKLDAQPKLKIPFSIHGDELQYFSQADVRLGGFGPWFGGILLLAVLLLLYCLWKKRRFPPEIWIAVGVLAALALVFPESWWARYNNYTFYIPVLILLGASLKKDGILQGLTAAAFWLNSLVIAVFVLYAGVRTTGQVQGKLAEIQADGRPVLVKVNDFPSHRKLFEEYGIDYEMVHRALDNPTVFFGTTKYEYKYK